MATEPPRSSQVDPGERALSADLEGVAEISRTPRALRRSGHPGSNATAKGAAGNAMAA